MKQVLVIAAALLCLEITVEAGMPTGCVDPPGRDNFQSVAPGVRIMDACPSSMASCLPVNKLLCAFNKMQAELGSVSNEVRSACTATSITPGERKLVTVTISGTPLAGTEPAFASVKDTTAPSRLEADGIQALNANSANVWVFNHDPQTTRSGTVCVMVAE